MTIRRLLLASALLPLALSALNAQLRTIDTDKEPSTLFVDRATGRVHLITAGYDRDFDGTFQPDSGDVLPRWMVIDPATERVIDSMTFDGYFGSYPIRVGVDQARHLLYAGIGGRVRAYDLNTMQITRDTVALGFYAAVSYDSLTNRLMLAARPSFTDPGYVVTLDAATGDTLLVAQTGMNPTMSETRFSPVTQTSEHYTLNEGMFSSPSATISYSLLQPDIFAALNQEGLGGGGNEIAVRGERAYMVMNGTHQIRIVDTRTHTEVSPSPIEVGTTGFDGPRVMAFQGDSTIVVGTYSSELRRFSLSTGALIDSIAMPGKVEALAVHDSLAFAAIYNTAGTYDPDSLVVVVNLNTGLPVDTIAVGLNPMALFIDKRGDLQVVVADTVPAAQRLVVFDGVTHAEKGRRSIPGSLGFPLRMAYDAGASAADDSLYIVLSDSLLGFPAANLSAPPRLVYVDAAKRGAFHGVALDGDNLLVTERPTGFSPDPGYVHVVRRADGHLLAKFRAGAYVSGAARITGERQNAMSYYALSEGNFSSPSSTLTLFEYQPNIFGSDTLGTGANHLLMQGSVAGIVTMNGNHTVVGADMDNWAIVVRIPTGTTGFDGPRETALLSGDIALVTTYTGDLRVMSLSAPSLKTIDVGGKAEGIAVAGGKIFVAVPFSSPSGFTPGTSVAVIDSNLAIASVRRDEGIASSTTLQQNYPNPAAALTSIRFGIDAPSQVTLKIYSTSGELLLTAVNRAMEPGAYTADLDVASLPGGSYIYVLQAGSTTLSKIMQVVR